MADQGATSELKPCPFCGERERLRPFRFMQVAATNRQYVICVACETHGPVGDGEEAAIAAWNRRA